MADKRIVAIGFLRQTDLDRLGNTFTAHVPIADDDIFDGLLAQLDSVEASPLGKGISIMPNKIR